MRDRSKSPNGPESPGERPAEEAVGRRLWAALEPPPGVAGRIARRALDDEGRPAPPWMLRAAVTVVGLALVAVALAALLVLPRLRSGGGTPDGGESVAEEPVRNARYSITNRGEVLVVQALDGGPSALLANRATPGWRPSSPGRKLLVHGGTGP